MPTDSTWPVDPIGAVVHSDPFPYYDLLAMRRPWRDEQTEAWVVASAVDVAAVLGHPHARVRPAGHAVPPHLVGTAAGDLFGRLVRMRDDADRDRVREAIVGTIGSLPTRHGRVDELDLTLRAVASDLWDARDVATGVIEGQVIDEWIRQAPIAMVAELCGLPQPDLAALVAAAGSLAASFAPGADEDQAIAASAAADVLTDAIHRSDSTGIAGLLIDAIGPAGLPNALANIAGLFFQTFDATAGLIGSAIASLPTSQTAGELVHHLLSVEPPVHNTRRFIVADVEINGAHMAPGDEVLVLLVAAARDPSSSVQFAFGHGRHQCPASTLAATIAEHALAPLMLRRGDDVPPPTGFVPSRNVRIPVFATATSGTGRADEGGAG